jgi:uncharacterized protein
MYLKIHHSYRKVVAVCDADLIGKKFEEGKKQLEIKEGFFKGESFEDERVKDILKKERLDDSTFNIVGENAVKLALESEIITENNIGKVAGVPFALVLI